jgi:integrase
MQPNCSKRLRDSFAGHAGLLAFSIARSVLADDALILNVHGVAESTMRIKFTESALRQLSVPRGEKDCQWFDDSLQGFGLRKFASGRGAYFVKYQLGKQQRKITLGPYVPGILIEMRKRAGEILANVRLGIDVRSELQEKREQADPLFGDLLQTYLEAREKNVAAEWYKELCRFLQCYWAPLHMRTLRSLQRGELTRELDKIAATRGAVTADHCRKALSGLFGWAIDRGFADANPLARLKRYAKNTARDRVLSLPELIAVWKSIRADDYGRIVGLLLLTLQRRDEISQLVWQEIDLVDQHIQLPKERTKNSLAHLVPLSKPASDLLSAVPIMDGREHVFGEGKRGFQGWSKAKARLDISVRRSLNPELMMKFEAATGDLRNSAHGKGADQVASRFGYETANDLLYGIMPHWTLHDLRRTGATLMNELGLAEPHIIEAILNHISGASKAGVAGVYNRAKYEDQKRWALERWADLVLAATAEYDKGGAAAVEAFGRREKQKLKKVS